MPSPDPYVQPGSPCPPDWPDRPAAVLRFRDTDTPALTPLPNVLPVAVQQREGADPGSALVRYDFTSPLAGAPTSIEQAIDTAFTGAHVVEPGDQLVVRLTRPDDSTEMVFHGKALEWRIVLTGDPPQEECWITLTGIAKDAWAAPIGGQLMRDADAPDTVKDTQTDVPAAFNPRGLPNCTPDDADAGDGDTDYPTFLDPLVVRDPDVRTHWTLEKAARYILGKENAGQDPVRNPDFAQLKTLLVARVPNTDTGSFDPNDASTYTVKPITVPDTPISGKDWPSLLYDMIRDYGFGYRFDLTTDDNGHPRTTIRPYYQQTGPTKALYVQAKGEALDRALSNTVALDASRDLRDAANEWHVEGALFRWEASFILRPGFPSAAADGATGAALSAFNKSDPSYNEANHDAYRLWVFDETSEGHYAPGSTTADKTVPSLDALFGEGQYARRRRKPIGQLLTRDPNGKPLKARLSISRDYAQGQPGLWDGTGTWQNVAGGWSLLTDRLGIRVTADNPNKWKIGESSAATAPYPAGVVKGVEDLLGAHFTLRLTCCVDADQGLVGVAARRTNSPLPETVVRKIDARDRYRKDTIKHGSEFNNVTPGDTVDRDDSDAAQYEAKAVRYTTEAGVMTAEFELSHLTTYYQIGDRISTVAGRNTPLRTDKAVAGENPVLPLIVGRRLEFYPDQKTVLVCTDAGMARGKFKHAIKARQPNVQR